MANHTILLIDYEPRSIERFRQPLTAAGYRVEIATDGIAGVEAFTRLSPDMVLVEAMIPKKHGFEVCQELKRTPHGRRTPIIITTGVYKGRKYRTQALHIYGCDEYIEKPIAAEQLLAIVERFLSTTATSSREPVAATVDAGESASALTADAPRTVSEASPSRPPAHKPGSSPKAMVADLTEDEIMARLDAILPGSQASAGDGSLEEMPDAAPIELAPPEPEPEPDPVMVVEPEPAVESDPFLKMQAELTAELGSLSTALALDPVPILEPVPDSIPSDQADSRPLLESFPDPANEATIPLAPGQVVSFDVKRSRKNKKSGRKHGSSAHTAEPGAPMQSPTLARATEPPSRPSREMAIPSGTLVESALSSENRSRGIPAWAWIVGGAIALVVVYFVFLSGGSTPSRTSFEPSRTPRTVEAPPPPAETAPKELAEVAAPPKASANPDARLVLNAVGPQPSLPVSAPPAPSVPKPAAKPAETVTKGPASRVPNRQLPTVEPPSAPAGLDLGADAGVETIAAPVEAVAPRPTTARGALVDLAEVDSVPASLTRKLPLYSMQARQMRLQGTVVMKVLIDELGKVEQVVVVSGINGGDLNDAAVKAARQWTYRPASKDGVPVKVWTTEQVTFKI